MAILFSLSDGSGLALRRRVATRVHDSLVFHSFWCQYRNSCPQFDFPNQGVILVSTMTRYHCCTLPFLAHLCMLILEVMTVGSWTREVCGVKNCTPTATPLEKIIDVDSHVVGDIRDSADQEPPMTRARIDCLSNHRTDLPKIQFSFSAKEPASLRIAQSLISQTSTIGTMRT